MIRATPDGRSRPIQSLLFSTLFPNASRPLHGIFVETRLRKLLSSSEVKARVVAPVPWFPSRNPRFGEWARSASVPRSEVRHGTDIEHPRYLLPPKVGMSLAPILLATGASSAIRRMLAAGCSFDLIDAHYYYPDGAAAALLSRWFDIPFVVTGRGTDLNLLPNYAIPRRWIQWTIGRAHASVVVSEALSKRLVSLGADPNRVHLIRNGVDTQQFCLLDREACRADLGLSPGTTLLSVGNFYPFKGHDIAIDALVSLPEDTRLAIIGDGEDRKRLEALIAARGLAHRVTLVGTTSQSELVRWYNAADVLVLASAREGTPNVILEALACGLRVVATAVGGIPEIVRSRTAGLLVERNADAIAAAVRDIVAEPTSRDAVRDCVSNLTWAETTRRQIELFRAVIEANSEI